MQTTKYTNTVTACLEKIENEMARLYWNKHQKEMNSPFRNTGKSYKDDTFAVNAYNWNNDDNAAAKPNFKYHDFEVSWYKNLGRGTSYRFPNREPDIDFLEKMIQDCFDSMQRTFENKETS